MLKQAVPPINVTTSIDPLGLSSHPPLNTLPHWTRVNNLTRTCPPKPLLKDRLQPLPNMHATAVNSASGSSTFPPNYDELRVALDDVAMTPSDGRTSSSRREFYLEHCIAFLRQEHNEILASLHDELDRLKRENRDLQFRLTLADDRSLSDLAANCRSSSGRNQHLHSISETSKVSEFTVESQQKRPDRPGSRGKLMEQKEHGGLEVEVLELRQALKDEKHHNLLLEEQLERAKSDRLSDVVLPSSDGGNTEMSAIQRRLRAPRPPAQPRPSADRPRRTSATLASSSGSDTATLPQPSSASSALLYKFLDSAPAASSATLQQLNTVDECREFIRKLELENSKQSEELNRLKTDLRDALYSHKWTPDAFLVAKAYIATDCDQSGVTTTHPSHRVPLRPVLKKIPDAAYAPHDSLSLPPMKLALGPKAVDRTKRTQHLLNRTRLDRDLLSTHDAADGH